MKLTLSLLQEYLASKNFVHRDLAARNVLDDDLIYLTRTNRKLPLKWMSLEAVINEEFTMYSDV